MTDDPKRGRGRPRTERPSTTKIAASVPADIAEALRLRAAAENRTPSSCVREAVEEWLSARR